MKHNTDFFSSHHPSHVKYRKGRFMWNGLIEKRHLFHPFIIKSSQQQQQQPYASGCK